MGFTGWRNPEDDPSPVTNASLNHRVLAPGMIATGADIQHLAQAVDCPECRLLMYPHGAHVPRRWSRRGRLIAWAWRLLHRAPPP